MRLEDVKFGDDGVYSVRGTERTCYVITCYPDDGAALIAEFHDADGDILSGELFMTEACRLEPAAVPVGARKTLNYSRDELPAECPGCNNIEMGSKMISRDTYTEVRESYCEICRETYNITITED